ncbi:uncharacterized protein RCO7_03998 [Rhynchosporium graminicola]|uniref:Uncharacterized protein n=1 Tax=Rhynchosporium graminicola TaxID=2792576 RepID=A0A1E1LQ23_9HELO|nr:uncharacterized protein RCO7_03998 [Rhynchosporium commune]
MGRDASLINFVASPVFRVREISQTSSSLRIPTKLSNMSSRVIDLTSDASDDEPEAAIPQPIKTSVAAQNGSAISHPIVSAALRKAITIVDPTHQYHMDSNPENHVSNEAYTDEEVDYNGMPDNIIQTRKLGIRERMPISIGNKEFTPRKGTFFDDDVWADHDDDCHGDPNSFDEDPDFADGFRWSCYETPGDNEGCMNTRHKAAVNVVQLTRPSKRKAEEEVPNMRM